MINDFTPIAYEFRGSNPMRGDPITIEIRDGFKGRKWCIKQFGNVFTKEIAWELEMQPSSRSEEFQERARFNSAEEAARFLLDNLSKAQERV